MFFSPSSLMLRKKQRSIIHSYLAGFWEGWSHLTGVVWGKLWTSLSQGLDTDNQPCSLTPIGNIDSPVKLTCMSLGYGRKPAYSDGTTTNMGRICRYTMIMLEIKPVSLFEGLQLPLTLWQGLQRMVLVTVMLSQHKMKKGSCQCQSLPSLVNFLGARRASQ